VLRLAGNLGFYLGRLVVNIYDLIIFPGLWLEGVLGKRLSKEKAPEAKEAVGKSKGELKPVKLMEGAASCEEASE
jgi:hypothetical protein